MNRDKSPQCPNCPEGRMSVDGDGCLWCDRCEVPPERAARMESGNYFRLIQDDDCHWYVIPVSESALFRDWVEAGPYWENYSGPRYDDRRVDGPHSVVFKEYAAHDARPS